MTTERDAIQRLSERFGKWLVQQKEWPLILGMPRSLRKEFAKEIAKRLTRWPAP